MKKERLLCILSVVILVIIGLCLRLLYINSALWYDEACSWTTAVKSFPTGIMNNLLEFDLQHTPLYFFLLHFWIQLFGDGEITMRVLSLIFAIATIPLTYIVTKKISTENNALFASAITAINPLLVLFGVEIRMYIIAAFLVLLSINFLIDFEQKEKKKSLLFLCLTNILIPYTLVGASFYNLSLLIFYGKYLYKNNREKFNRYRNFAIIEWAALIPYFILISYYATQRINFVVAHEGSLAFFNIVDVIRNFFGAYLNPNVFWPARAPYDITFLFTLFVIVPCVYFVWGFCCGQKKSTGFMRVLYNCVLTIFIIAIIFALLKVNVFTCRYLLYLLIPCFILSVISISQNLSSKHFKIFLITYLICSTYFNIADAKRLRYSKMSSFKAVSIEAKQLNLGTDDIVIMPFGGDADYYFNDISMPKLFFSDFHKTVRNPYGFYYDKDISSSVMSEDKYKFLYNSIINKEISSKRYYEYFVKNVNLYVPQGRFVLIAMYDDDVAAIISIDDLKSLVKDKKYLKNNYLDAFFKKYMCDIIAMLNLDFVPIKKYQKGNYTYFLFQKK